MNRMFDRAHRSPPRTSRTRALLFIGAAAAAMVASMATDARAQVRVWCAQTVVPSSLEGAKAPVRMCLADDGNGNSRASLQALDVDTTPGILSLWGTKDSLCDTLISSVPENGSTMIFPVEAGPIATPWRPWWIPRDPLCIVFRYWQDPYGWVNTQCWRLSGYLTCDL